MSTTEYPSARNLLASVPATEQGTAKVQFPYKVGLLARGAFADVIAFGRSLGLDVNDHRGGGIFERRGYVALAGPWPKVRQFLDRWVQLEDASREEVR